jgi:hypothetical protein
MRGLARLMLGESDGVADSEEAAAILARLSHPRTTVAYNNLAEYHARVGRLALAHEAREAQREWAARVGDAQVIGYADAALAEECYPAGEWDEVLRVTAPHLGSGDKGVESWARMWRAWVRLGREGPDAALDEARLMIEYGQSVGNEEVRVEALSFQAVAFKLRAETTATTRTLQAILEELAQLDGYPASPRCLAEIAVVVYLEAEADMLRQLLARVPRGWLWSAATEASLAGDHAQAAERYREIGSQPLEAAAYTRAAEVALSRGRHTEAQGYISRAGEFYSSVGATFLASRLAQLRDGGATGVGGA